MCLSILLRLPWQRWRRSPKLSLCFFSNYFLFNCFSFNYGTTRNQLEFWIFCCCLAADWSIQFLQRCLIDWVKLLKMFRWDSAVDWVVQRQIKSMGWNGNVAKLVGFPTQHAIRKRKDGGGQRSRKGWGGGGGCMRCNVQLTRVLACVNDDSFVVRYHVPFRPEPNQNLGLLVSTGRREPTAGEIGPRPKVKPVKWVNNQNNRSKTVKIGDFWLFGNWWQDQKLVKFPAG